MWTSSSKTSVSGELTTSSASWETEDKEDQGKVNILPCEGHHFNPEYFPEGLSLGYQDQSIYGDLRNTNQGQCWYSRLASHSQSRRNRHVVHTACCTKVLLLKEKMGGKGKVKERKVKEGKSKGKAKRWRKEKRKKRERKEKKWKEEMVGKGDEDRESEGRLPQFKFLATPLDWSRPK